MKGLHRWIAGRRAPLLAALIALAAALPALVALPVLDRDEARAAQGAAQMLEDGDYTAIRFQSSLRGGTAPGAPWLQALSVKAVSSVEARAIQAYRLPSLFGIMLAAGACAWGAAGLFGGRAGGVAGALFGAGLFAALAGGTAGADGLFIGACALALAAFGRLYQSEGKARTRALFWTGIILGVLVKGPLILGLALLTGTALFAFDRRAPWLRGLGWGWGLIALAAIAGPWVVAVTVATDGAFWTREAEAAGKGAAFGVQALAAPFLIFPAAAFLPLGAVFAWRHRKHPGVRLAAAWAVPAWLVFELAPGKQAHDAAPLYIALIWLAAAAVTAEWTPDKVTRRIGAGLGLACGLALAAAALVLATRFGQGGGDIILAALTAALILGATTAAALAALLTRPVGAILVACALAVLAQGMAFGALLPGLDRLWPTREVLTALTRSGLDPRQGIAVGPVASAGYAEPSLVFSLGAGTETGDARSAAAAIDEGRPAIIEDAEDTAFRQEAKKLGARPKAAATVEGFDYVQAMPVRLTIYGPQK